VLSVPSSGVRSVASEASEGTFEMTLYRERRQPSVSVPGPAGPGPEQGERLSTCGCALPARCVGAATAACGPLDAVARLLYALADLDDALHRSAAQRLPSELIHLHALSRPSRARHSHVYQRTALSLCQRRRRSCQGNSRRNRLRFADKPIRSQLTRRLVSSPSVILS